MDAVKRYYWNADSIDNFGYGSMYELGDASSLELVGIADFDAQRLRADTAEAELVASHQREARLQEMISELSELLEEVLDEVPHGWGESFSGSELAERIRAALNPKPEAGSQ